MCKCHFVHVFSCWQILPDGTVWLPKLVEHIVDIATSSIPPVVIDKKLIEGPDANKRGKIYVPLILLAQVATEFELFVAQV